MKTQSENESTHIITVMREEKQMLMQKIHQYEREAGERGGAEKRVKELEETVARLTTELGELRRTGERKD